MVRCEDGGPAIFRQERIGRFGRPFNIYKFRSMTVDAEKNGPQLCSHKKDERLTRIGKFLRKHHLDELPQLWNVLCGDMSFIGPRPERKFYIDQIMERDPRYKNLYQIRPGVTSYATLYNGYTDTMEKMLRRLDMDLYYLEHRSWWFDAKNLRQDFHQDDLRKSVARTKPYPQSKGYDFFGFLTDDSKAPAKPRLPHYIHRCTSACFIPMSIASCKALAYST